MGVKLYVGNLPFKILEEELQQLFSQAGEVASVALIKDRDTGKSRGFAFVEMSSQAEAEKAISMFNNYSLNNRPLTVNLARPREERPGGGGGGYGGGRGGGGNFDRRDRNDESRERRGPRGY